MYAMSLAQGDSNVQYRRKKVQSKPSWNHLEEIKNIKKKLQFQIYIYIFMVLSNRDQTAHIKDLHITGTQYWYVYLFLSTKWLLPTKGFVLHLLVDLCSSVSLIIRFLESISRVWIFSNLLGYVFLRAKHYETCRGRA